MSIDKHLQPELSRHLNGTGHFIGNSNPGDMSYPSRYAMPRQAPTADSRPPEQTGRGRHLSRSYDSSNSNSRRGSVEFSGSESASGGHTSGSMPSSATSSSVHLPPGGVDYGNVSWLCFSSVFSFVFSTAHACYAFLCAYTSSLVRD